MYDKEIGSKDILKFPFQDPAYSFGPKSYAFRQLTQPRKGDKGFSREAGRILSASGDAALKNIIPKLKDDIYRVAASIFMFPVSPTADKMTHSHQNNSYTRFLQTHRQQTIDDRITIEVSME